MKLRKRRTFTGGPTRWQVGVERIMLLILLFEVGNSAADTRGCDAEQASGPPETARIDNSHKRYDAAQEA